MAEIVYVLCAILSVACAVFLYRGYRFQKSTLLLWSSCAFALLAVNNLILFVDLVLFPELDFNGALLRNAAGAVGGFLLLSGLIWEST